MLQTVVSDKLPKMATYHFLSRLPRLVLAVILSLRARTSKRRMGGWKITQLFGRSASGPTTTFTKTPSVHLAPYYILSLRALQRGRTLCGFLSTD